MAIVISGVNNNDRITATDGVIDSLSGFNLVGVVTATTFSGDLTGNVTGNISGNNGVFGDFVNVGSNIQIGQAGILTATTFVGNVTGNINNSTLLLQTGGYERLRIDAGGGVQVGTSTATASKVTVYGANDAAAIFQGSSTGTGAANGFLVGNNGGTDGLLWNYENGNTKIATNNVERLRIASDGVIIGRGELRLTQGTSDVSQGAEIGSLMFLNPSNDNRNAKIVALRTTGTSGADLAFYTRIHGDATNTDGGTEKLRISSNGTLTQTSTKAFQIAKGSTSDRPTGVVGMVRFNTETDTLENFNATTGWVNVNVKTPNITSITGNIYAGMATNLTINGTDFDFTVTVIFKEGSTTKATLTNQSVSSNSLTVAVPSAVYGESAGDTITITVTNTDGVVSSGSDKTIQSSPSGGTITTSGNYRIHTFTSSGNFVNTVASLGVEYLIIAGGGGGGSAGSGVAGGGGGAGGYRSNVSGQSSGGGNSAESAMTLSATTYAVVVGAGAAKPTNNADQGGVRGSNSSFNSITSTGGGGGGGNGADAAQGSGGSGGGGKESNGVGGSGTSGQGYAGGSGSESGNAGGGGGGAGEAGNTDGFAYGGDGVSSNITGSAVTRGGGGSSGNTQGLQPPGGVGGGAQASNNNQVDGGNGTANTGGGGGGGYSTGGKGGAGGSGIVIIRYNTTTIS